MALTAIAYVTLKTSLMSTVVAITILNANNMKVYIKKVSLHIFSFNFSLILYMRELICEIF